MQLKRDVCGRKTVSVPLRQDGLTLLETLASVVVLAIFSTVLLMVLSSFLFYEHLSVQEQQASMLANQQFTVMAQQGALVTLNTTEPKTLMYDGTTYHLSLLNLTSTEPRYANGLVDVEVTVSWVTTFRGTDVTERVTLKQLFTR